MKTLTSSKQSTNLRHYIEICREIRTSSTHIKEDIPCDASSTATIELSALREKLSTYVDSNLSTYPYIFITQTPYIESSTS